MGTVRFSLFAIVLAFTSVRLFAQDVLYGANQYIEYQVGKRQHDSKQTKSYCTHYSTKLKLKFILSKVTLHYLLSDYTLCGNFSTRLTE